MFRNDKLRQVYPYYDESSDYNTNAKSYLDYLAKSNKLYEILAARIWEYEEKLNLTLEEINDKLTSFIQQNEDMLADMLTKWDERIDNLDDEVSHIFVTWLNDGTLEQIINHDVLGNKADKSFVDVEIERLNQKDENTDTKINELKSELELDITSKREKGTGLIHISDYTQLENETDDQFINRVLTSIPLRDDEFREGTLVLESKDYILTDSVVLGQYQQLQGAGRGTRLKLEDSTKPIIRLDNNLDDESLSVYGVSINDVSLWGSDVNIGIKIIGATHLIIRNVYIYNTIKGIEADGIWLGRFDRVTIRNYNRMGEFGFHITGGESGGVTSTSLLFDNTWVKNFKRGYDIGTALYSSFNATACDTFTHFAYNGGSAVTYNGVGAEDGNLIDGGCVFRAGARPVVFNTPNIMNITYEGEDEAYIFYFNGSLAEINGFRWQAGVIPENLKYIYLGGICKVDLSNSHFPTTLEDRERFTWVHQHSNILERASRTLIHYDKFRSHTISDLSSL